MKRFLTVLIFVASSLIADEVGNLETLIATTQSQLIKQQKTLELFKQFQNARAAFVAQPESARLGTVLVRAAMQLHEAIDTAHLAHLFPIEFLEEVAFFSDVGQTHHIRR